MNYDKLFADMPEPSTPAVRGEWFNLRWKPNLATGEILNLGVVFRDSSGKMSARVLDYFDRLKCMYDDEFAESAEFLAKAVRGELERTGQLPSPNVFLSEPKLAQGATVQAIIDGLYKNTVPLGRRKSGDDLVSTAVESAGQTSPDSVRQQVLDAVKKALGLQAHKIIRGVSRLEVNDQGNVHFLDIPLQADSALGAIVAAARKSPKNADVAMGSAQTDLLVASKTFLQNKLFMYVVREPGSGKKADLEDQRFDEHVWKLGRIGINVRASLDPQQTAEDIIEDMVSG